MQAPTAIVNTTEVKGAAFQPRKPKGPVLAHGMLDELLLVCQFVGTKKVADDDSPSRKAVDGFVRGEDCVAWLQDLQRALRRDDDDAKAIRTTVGAWDVLRSKLLPLAEASAGDRVATRTLCKIFVLLTMPLSDKCHQALQAAPDPKKDKERSAKALETRATLREAATAQVRQLTSARRAFAERPAVLRALSHMFAGLRRERRAAEDDVDVELALTLLRNLVAPQPALDGSSAAADEALDLLTKALRDELVLDQVLGLCATAHRRENRQWGLVLVEVLAPLLASHRPADCAAAEFEESRRAEKEAAREAVDARLAAAVVGRDARGARGDEHLRRRLDDALKKPVGGGALSRARDRERLARTLGAASRHNRFGTCLRVKPAGDDDDPGRVVAGTAALRSRASLQGATGNPLATAAAAGRRRPTFLPPGKVGVQAKRGGGRKKKDADEEEEEDERPHRDELSDDDGERDDDWGQRPRRDEALRLATSTRRGVAADDARRAVASVASRLARDGARLLDVAKNEIRADSVRVVPRDRHNFAALAEWLLAWRRERAALLAKRLERAARHAAPDDVVPEGLDEAAFFPRALLKLLDKFTFKFCLDDVDNATTHKKPLHLERSAGLYRELLRALEALRHGDRTSRRDRARLGAGADETNRAVAGGMLNEVFYAPEAADPLPHLLRTWAPGRHSKRYACDIVEICHATCKLLESDDRPFDFGNYLRKLLKPVSTLDLYGALLEAHASNAPAVNHFVYAFLRRVAVCPLEDGAKRPPSSKRIETLEPLLYRARYFVAFASILDDRSDDATASLLKDLASSTLRHFDAHAQTRPLLYVEALFGHGGRPVDQWVRGLAYDAQADTAMQRLPLEDAGPAWDRDDQEADVDEDMFERLEEEDAAAARRLAAAKAAAPPKVAKKRWQPAEDASLCVAAAAAWEADQEFDAARGAKLSSLLTHHRDERLVRLRVQKLHEAALKAFPPRDGEDEADAWVRAMRSRAAALAAKKPPKPRAKRAAADAMDVDDDDEEVVGGGEEEEAEAAVDDAEEAELELDDARRSFDDAEEAEAELDDKWSDRRSFKRAPAPEAAPAGEDAGAAAAAPPRSRLKRPSAADASDSDDGLEVAPPAAPPAEAAAPAPASPATVVKKRRKVVAYDEDEDE